MASENWSSKYYDKKKFPTISSILRPLTLSYKYECEYCHKKFTKPSYVIRHKKQFHKVEAIPSCSTISKAYKCRVCNISFSCSRSCRRHEKKAHQFDIQYQQELKCFKCKMCFHSRKKILSHFSEEHDEVQLKKETKVFQTAKDFQVWKYEIQNETASEFILRQRYHTKDHSIEHYICHRTGTFKSRGKGQRHSKINGTNKSDYFCPAIISVKTCLTKGSLEVTFLSTHLGHKCEAERLRLTKPEKDDLACLMCLGVPKSTLVHYVSETASPNSRLAITTIKDLCNISASYRIDTNSTGNEYDGRSVDRMENI